MCIFLFSVLLKDFNCTSLKDSCIKGYLIENNFKKPTFISREIPSYLTVGVQFWNMSNGSQGLCPVSRI